MCTCMQDGLRKLLKGGMLKIEVIPHQHSMSVCVGVRFYLTTRKGAGSLGDCTTQITCKWCCNIIERYVTNLSKCLQRELYVCMLRLFCLPMLKKIGVYGNRYLARFKM